MACIWHDLGPDARVYQGGTASYVHLFARRWFPDAMSFAAKPWRSKLADTKGQRTVLKQERYDSHTHILYLYIQLPRGPLVLLFLDTKIKAYVCHNSTRFARIQSMQKKVIALFCTPSRTDFHLRHLHRNVGASIRASSKIGLVKSPRPMPTVVTQRPLDRIQRRAKHMGPAGDSGNPSYEVLIRPGALHRRVKYPFTLGITKRVLKI